MAGDLRSVWSTTSTYDLHKRLINQYILCRPGATTQLKRDTSRDRRDIDVIRENHRFLWDENEGSLSWEAKLARKYYDKLFKEYAICDLTHFKSNVVAMRWRVEKEVVSGKGQFSCGEKHCSNSEDLRTWEVNFGYLEKGEKKNALVKIRLCEECSVKLNSTKKHREVTKSKKNTKQTKKRNISTDQEVSVGETKKIKTEKVDEVINEDARTVNDDEERAAWRGVGELPEEKSREEEFNDYLQDLFL
ncbi:hypothetical protein R5R35_014092 [Gryllus longicercus]|uniref:Protein FRA10AC1 n=1 Tax=Gryllus longicercus TaxID=2509291 RepID=A0AAN9VVI1_9ORTH